MIDLEIIAVDGK